VLKSQNGFSKAIMAGGLAKDPADFSDSNASPAQRQPKKSIMASKI